MAAPYWTFHLSFQIEFEMLSKPVTTFGTDTNGRSIPMATTVNSVKSIQSVPCSWVMKVLFDSKGSESVISKTISPIRVQITMIQATQFFSEETKYFETMHPFTKSPFTLIIGQWVEKFWRFLTCSFSKRQSSLLTKYTSYIASLATTTTTPRIVESQASSCLSKTKED